MKNFQIWIEGYAATGEHSTASYVGESEGETFLDACKNFRYPKDIVREWDGAVLIKAGSELPMDKNADGSLRLNRLGNPTSWACGYYDNEADARKYFG